MTKVVREGSDGGSSGNLEKSNPAEGAASAKALRLGVDLVCLKSPEESRVAATGRRAVDHEVRMQANDRGHGSLLKKPWPWLQVRWEQC